MKMVVSSLEEKNKKSEVRQAIQKQQNSGVLHILQEAIRIYFKNFNYAIFTFLASIPLIGFTV